MIQIEKATVEHAELISQLGEKSFIESHGNSASKEDINNFILKTYNKEEISQEFENTQVFYHIIYYNNEAAGFSKIELNTINKNVNELDLTKLDRIYLLKDYHGLGLGLELINHNIKFSKKSKQNGIWLAVWIENQRAINFYTKMGFDVVGKYDFHISETHSNPNHIMYLKY